MNPRMDRRQTLVFGRRLKMMMLESSDNFVSMLTRWKKNRNIRLSSSV